MWFKVDDKLWGHAKWLAVPGRARGLWVTAGSWAAANETDGKIPRHVIQTLGGTKRDADALCDAGLWREVKAGWLFHEWSLYQPDAASLKAKRRAEADGGALGNHRRWHVGKNVRVPDCDYCNGAPQEQGIEPPLEDPEAYRVPDQGPEGVPESPPNRPVPDPTRPDPTHKEQPSSSEVATATPRPDEERPEVEAILDSLEAGIAANDAMVPARGKKARDAIRLMLDRDGRTVDQINAAIDYATTDEFWRANILSAAKLREKFDQLRLSAQRGGWKPVDRHQRDAEFWESEMAASLAADQGAVREIEQ